MGSFSRAGSRGFVKFVANAANFEHLALRLDWDVHSLTHATHGARGVLFHCIADRSDPDGTPFALEAGARLLSKLRSLELQGHHHLDPSTLLSFLGERKKALNAVALGNVFASGRPYVRIARDIDYIAEAGSVRRAIREAVGATEETDYNIILNEVYFGSLQ